MTLEDYARIYARRCAVRTTFRFVRPLLAYRVRNAANSNSAPSSQRAGAGCSSLSTVSPTFSDLRSHGPAHSGVTL